MSSRGRLRSRYRPSPRTAVSLSFSIRSAELLEPIARRSSSRHRRPKPPRRSHLHDCSWNLRQHAQRPSSAAFEQRVRRVRGPPCPWFRRCMGATEPPWIGPWGDHVHLPPPGRRTCVRAGAVSANWARLSTWNTPTHLPVRAFVRPHVFAAAILRVMSGHTKSSTA